MQKIITKHSKNITSIRKNIKRYLTGEEKILTLSFKNITLSFGILTLSFLCSNSAFADTLDYTVNVAPSLNISLSGDTEDGKLVLNINPNNKTSDSKNLIVKVGTNNITGYKLIMSTLDDTTDLVRDNTDNLDNATIPTLSSTDTTGTLPSDLANNRWGYKLNHTGNFIPFTSNTKLLENHTATNEDSTILTFASKIDYNQMAGRYVATLAFTATANPLIYYMQDFTKDLCIEKASEADFTVVDIRDGNDYQVRYINGYCWMVQNLRYKGDTGSNNSGASGSIMMKSATSNINTDKTISYTDLTAGNTYDAARIHDSNNTTNGIWYNYAAASAMTITGSSNSTTATSDVCPKGWRLPTNSEFEAIGLYYNEFQPVGGGCYRNGSNIGGDNMSYTWASTAPGATNRYTLYKPDGSYDPMVDSRAIYTYRYFGYYVRCIAK